MASHTYPHSYSASTPTGVAFHQYGPTLTPRALLGETVHVWVVKEEPDSLTNELTAEEKDRAARYKIPTIRKQFEIHRTALRRILSAYLVKEPLAVELTVAPTGKPILKGEQTLHFNVSHTKGMGLVAVSKLPVGVDVEPIRVVDNAAGLIDRYFAWEEKAEYAQMPEELKQHSFFQGWTCKEALLKGHGLGMRAMECCAVAMDPREPARVKRFDGYSPPIPWQLHAWAMEEPFVAALALQR